MKRFVLFSVLALSTVFAAAATNDLVITSITKQEDCVTLQWRSHPEEYYTVYWTDRLELPIFWRVAEVNVPSGGTNTVWTEGSCSESMMAGLGSGGGGFAQPSAQKGAAEEKPKEYDVPDYLYPPGHPKAPKTTSKSATNPTPVAEGGGFGGEMALLSGPATANKFYRVARTAVAGFVDGWGGTLGATLESLAGLGSAFAVSASPRGDAGAHSLALLTNGLVTAWGNNFYNQLIVPTNLVDVVAVAAGGRHSMALTRDGEVVMWGNTTLGQITNRPAAATNIAAIAAGIWHSMALRADGTVFAWGDLFNRTNPVPAGLSNVVAIAAGPRHCLALRHNGTVAAWGFDYDFLKNFMPTNVPTDLSNVVAICAGMEYNQALLRDGTVRVWGRTNSAAVVNVPTALTNLVAVSAGWHYGLALMDSLAVVSWGQDEGAPGISAVVGFSAGAHHALVLRTNDQAPVIRRQPRELAAPVGSSNRLDVFATSGLPLRYQWQRSSTNLSGATNAALIFANLQDTDDGLYRVRVSTDAGKVFSRVATVVAVHPPVITNQTPELNIYRPQDAPFELLAVGVYSKGTDRLAYDWYHDGQDLANAISPFGISSHLPLSFRSTNNEGAYHVIVRNIAGNATSAVWTVNIRLYGETTGWGDNSYGQLTTSRHETNLVAVSAGALHNLALRENSTVVAWGDNFYGQTNVPTGLTNIIAIAAGNAHSLALKEDGTVSAWGWNFYGQTSVPSGATNVIGITAGSDHSLALRNNGTVGGWGDASFGALNIPSDLTNAMQVAAGDGLSYALLSNGTVRAWGSGGLGAVTVPTNLANVVQIAAAHTHGLALKSDGTVVGLGPDSGWGETQPPSGLSNVLQVSVGFMFSTALRNDGAVVAWGRYDYSQTNVPSNLGDVKQVSAGGYHALALAYNPVLNYPVNVPQDLLLIYNTNCPDSEVVMNYYRTNRPGIAAANVLGIGGATNAIERYADQAETTNTLLAPYQQWLANNPTKRPNFIVVMHGVPASAPPTSWPFCYSQADGVSYQLSAINPVRKPFVTHLNLRTPADCFAYVDKLRYFGPNCSPGKIYISANQNGYGNNTYHFDDIRAEDPFAEDPLGFLGMQGVLANGATSNSVVYTSAFARTSASHCTNVAGYMCWGYHGGLATFYPTNGQVEFHGQSSWYIVMSIESFNGQWSPCDFQTSYHFWFVENAFLGQAHAFTPVGAVTHLYEPSLGGVNDTYDYFGLWERGKCFAICAWRSRGTDAFQAVGDPFVRK